MEPEANRPLQEFPQNSNSILEDFIANNYEMALDKGHKFFIEGRFTEAYEVYQQLLESMTPSSQQPSQEIGLIYQKLGQTCLQKADYQMAYGFLTKSLDVTASLNNQDLFSLTRIQMDLGEVFFEQRKYAEANEKFQNSLDIIEEKYKEKYCELAICYNNLAKIAEKEKKYNDSLAYIDKAIKASERRDVDKDKNSELMRSYFLMASVNDYLKNYSLAQEYVEKARIMSESLFGISHPETALCYNLIGILYYRQGKNTKALENYKKALDIRIKSFGPNHPRVAACHYNMGDIYNDIGDYDEALKHYKNSLEINKLVLGEAHPDIAKCYNNIASVYYAQDCSRESLEYNQKALDIRIQLYGENHPDTAISYNALGIIYLQQNDYLRAQSSFEKSLKITLEYFGPKHPETAKLFHDLGLIFHDQLKFKEALPCYLKSLSVRTKDLYEFSDFAVYFYDTSVLFKQVGNEKLAENFSRRAYKIYQTSLGDMDPETQSSRDQVLHKQEMNSLFDLNSNF